MRTVLRDREAVILELSAYECHAIRCTQGRATLLPLREGDGDFPRRFGAHNSPMRRTGPAGKLPAVQVPARRRLGY